MQPRQPGHLLYSGYTSLTETPPSTTSCWPVMKPARCGSAKNRAASAMSSGCPSRPAQPKCEPQLQQAAECTQDRTRTNEVPVPVLLRVAQLPSRVVDPARQYAIHANPPLRGAEADRLRPGQAAQACFGGCVALHAAGRLQMLVGSTCQQSRSPAPRCQALRGELARLRCGPQSCQAACAPRRPPSGSRALQQLSARPQAASALPAVHLTGSRPGSEPTWRASLPCPPARFGSAMPALLTSTLSEPPQKAAASATAASTCCTLLSSASGLH